MARIRTIKPEFWTSEQIVECSPMARLLFIGMWNFCDDAGVHPASMKRLKMEIFPGDYLKEDEIESLVSELSDAGLIRHYVVDNKGFWAITGWHHQKIDRPSFKYPAPSCSIDNSTNDQRMIDERLPPEGMYKGCIREGKGGDVDLTAPRKNFIDQIKAIHSKHCTSNGGGLVITPSHLGAFLKWEKSGRSLDQIEDAYIETAGAKTLANRFKWICEILGKPSKDEIHEWAANQPTFEEKMRALDDN